MQIAATYVIKFWVQESDAHVVVLPFTEEPTYGMSQVNQTPPDKSLVSVHENLDSVMKYPVSWLGSLVLPNTKMDEISLFQKRWLLINK